MGSVVSSIGNAVSSIFGGGGSSSNPVPQTSSLSTYDPYSAYRGQAATNLNNLVNNPASAINTPGYQQTLQQGMRMSQAAGAATGTLQSGSQSAALQTLGQGTYNSFYNQLFNQYATLSGASQSPASATAMQNQSATANAALQNQINSQGQSNLLGLGSIGAGLYGNLTSANALNNLATTLGGGGGTSGGASNFASFGDGWGTYGSSSSGAAAGSDLATFMG
jgi:hypothetical protein